MPKYTHIEVSEQQLEDLVRQHVDSLEEGLRYVHHQRTTGSGRLDVLLVDSGNSLVLAELKIIEDDGMLFQALDYYDYVSLHLEALARMYTSSSVTVDPTQPVRLFLIAPSFSQSLIANCKWIDAPVSLFTYKCIKLENANDIIPVFSEQSIPSPPDILETYTLQDRLNYITDDEARQRAKDLLEKIQSWDPAKVLIEPIKYQISLKVSGRVFAYLSPRRTHFWIETTNFDSKWTGFPIHSDEDLSGPEAVVRRNFDRFHK